MEIRIFEITGSGFEPKLITHLAANIYYTVDAFTAGGFEIIFPFGAYGALEFQLNRLILIDKHYSGIITDIEYTTSGNAEMINISGYNLLGLLTQRLTVPPSGEFDSITSNAETCIKHYWNNNIASDASFERRIPFIFISANLGRGANTSYSSSMDLLSDVTSELAVFGGLVVTADVDILNSQFIFDVHEPKILTFGQQDNPPVVISVERSTALTMAYANGLTGSSNAFYVDDYVYTRPAEDSTGISRRERKLSVSVDTSGDLVQQVAHTMTQYEPIKSLTADVNFAKLKYREDYNVGDIITVTNHVWGVTADIQITAVTITADSSGTKTSLTLGADRMSVVEILIRNAKNS